MNRFSKLKIVADQQIPYLQQAFSKFADVVVYNYPEITAQNICDADVLLVRSVTRVDQQLLQGSQIKFVASATSGLDHVDLNYLQSNNIGFADARGSNARAVAEYVLSCLCVFADQYDLQIKGLSIGVVGCGRVGGLFVSMLEAIGAKVMMNDPPLNDLLGRSGSGYPQDINGVERYYELEALLDVDMLTLHVPLTTAMPYPTKHLLDADFLKRMKADTILVNTARGGVIDESALKRHLSQHAHARVALDVWQGEPEIDVDLLTHVDIATPHIAGYSAAAKLSASAMVFKSVCAFFGIDEEFNLCLPDDLVPELLVPDELEDEEAVKMAIIAAYDVRKDSLALRDLLTVGAEGRDICFREMRRDYPLRRGISSITVICPEDRKVLRQQLQQLGFSVCAP